MKREAEPEQPLNVTTRLGTVVDNERAAGLFEAMLKGARASKRRKEAKDNEQHATSGTAEAIAPGEKDGGGDE